MDSTAQHAGRLARGARGRLHAEACPCAFCSRFIHMLAGLGLTVRLPGPANARRLASRAAFEKQGRAMGATDLIGELGRMVDHQLS